MAGMRAKLYHDVQSAEDYQKESLDHHDTAVDGGVHGNGDGAVSEAEEEEDGLLTFTIHQLLCSSVADHSQEKHPSQFQIYWLFNAGSGSISDRSYESSGVSLDEPTLIWKFPSPATGEMSPSASVMCNDHLCFEFYQRRQIQDESATAATATQGSLFLGSVIIPIEDLIHSSLAASSSSSSLGLHCVEETIMSDEGDEKGQMELRFTLTN